MVQKECFPALGRWAPVSGHVLGNRRLADIDGELEEFSIDARSAPERICKAHLAGAAEVRVVVETSNFFHSSEDVDHGNWADYSICMSPAWRSAQTRGGNSNPVTALCPRNAILPKPDHPLTAISGWCVPKTSTPAYGSTEAPGATDSRWLLLKAARLAHRRRPLTSPAAFAPATVQQI
jgi:hypothetical protein